MTTCLLVRHGQSQANVDGVLAGHLDSTLTARVTARLLGRADKVNKLAAALSERESEVLRLIASGYSNKEIAELLTISVKTAMSHREHVMAKLQVHNRTELIRFALRAGVIREDG